jgi:Flp pilus assembly pilin Flp
VNRFREPFRKAFSSLRRGEGQALVEYALIIAFVALATVGALTLVGTSVNNLLNAVVGGL